MYTKLLSENPKEKDHSGNRGIDRRKIFKCVLKEQVLWLSAGFMLLRIGSSSGLL